METIMIITTWISILIAGVCVWELWTATKNWGESIKVSEEAIKIAKKAIALYEQTKREYDTFVEAHRLVRQDKETL